MINTIIAISGHIAHCIYVIIFLMAILGIALTAKILFDHPPLKSAYKFIKSNFLVFCGFSILGLSIGILSGSSLTPVIGSVVPSVLTFLGLIVIYQFTSKKMAKKNKDIVAISISLHCIFLLYGIDISSAYRMVVEEEREVKRHNMNKDLETHKNVLQIDQRKMDYKYDSLLIELNSTKTKSRISSTPNNQAAEK